MDKGKKFELVVAVIVALIGAGAIGFGITFVENHFSRPIISCQEGDDDESIEFELNEECRDAALILHPQIMICYGNKVLLLIYLDGYYEEDFLKFDNEGKCCAKIQHMKYVAELKKYLIRQIGEKVQGTVDLKDNLYTKVSSVGGVRYSNEKGNEEKRYCIIEKDGLVIDYNVDDDEILNRLYEYKIKLKDDISEIEKDEDIVKIIKAVSEQLRNQKW